MIEYKPDSSFCFWNGVELNDKNSTEIFGLHLDDCYLVENKKIITGEIKDKYVYIIEAKNIIDAVILFLKSKTDTITKYSYDNALDEEHGFSKKTKNTIINVTEDFYDEIKNIKLLKDFPSVNAEKCMEFIAELNKDLATS